MKQIEADSSLVAYCGLYCGACSKYLSEKCPGCHENAKATWCGIRTCCMEKGYDSCADCTVFSDPMKCGKYNNLISRVIGFVLRSNRAACIAQIRELGIMGHAEAMAATGRQSIRR